MPGKSAIYIAILLLLSCSSAMAQIEIYRDDSSFQKKLQYIISQNWRTSDGTIDPNRRLEIAALKATGQLLARKYTFLLGIVDASYFGGGKSGKALQNLTLKPFLFKKQQVSVLLDSAITNRLDLSTIYLYKIDAQLNELYLTNFINRNKEETVSGDDDQNIKVEVTVKVLESFAGKKEVPGYYVYSDNPFVKNSREDFSPTTNAIKKISPGWREFYIRKGKASQKQYWHVVWGDEHTYTIYFAEIK